MGDTHSGLDGCGIEIRSMRSFGGGGFDGRERSGAMQRISEVIEGAVVSGRWRPEKRSAPMSRTIYRYSNPNGIRLCPLALALSELGLLSLPNFESANLQAAYPHSALMLGISEECHRNVVRAADGCTDGDPIRILKDAGY